MQATIENREGYHVARITGDVDIGEEQLLTDELQPLVVEAHSRLVVDLSALKSINSMALSELINVVVRSRLNDSRVVLVAPKGFVRGVFSVTRLDGWFEMYDTTEQAAAALLG